MHLDWQVEPVFVQAVLLEKNVHICILGETHLAMSFGRIVICIPALNTLIYGSSLTLNGMSKIKRPAILAEAHKNLALEVRG